MKTMVTMTVNPSIDKSTRVARVTAEHKLYCKPPRFEPAGAAAVMTPGTELCRREDAERLFESMISGVAL